jgi:hypothetical protein
MLVGILVFWHFLAFWLLRHWVKLEEFNYSFFETFSGSIILESLCAEFMTMPYIVHVFGQASLIGLLANLLVASLVPLAMLLSFVAGLAGIIKIGLTSLLAWPAIVLLGAMLSITHVLASIPGIFIENINLSLLTTIVLYGLVTAIVIILNNKTKIPKYVNITDKKHVN